VGRLKPGLGLLEAEITGDLLLFFFARGEISYLFDDNFRNSLGLCDGLECSNTENKDCAMCDGDMLASATFGVKLLFRKLEFPISRSDEVRSCVLEDPATKQCKNGLGGSKGEAGESCKRDNDCIDGACGRLSFRSNDLVC